MKQSALFAKTAREAPKDEESKNAQLLVRAGFVEKLMAGVYSYLPLGLRTLRKIEQVVREEMDAIGGQEILMPILHPKENWVATGGWDAIEVLFKVKSRTKKEYALGQSEEEIVTPLVGHRVSTYRDLPLAVYQIHWKFRDELRAKSGLMRGREFLMKDMYSWHATQADFDRFYEVAKEAYFKVFSRLGLVAKATEASGGSFSKKISYEFMVLTEAGEDDILLCDACDFCVNTEIAKLAEGAPCPTCGASPLRKARAVEAGNVFDLGEKYAKDFGITFTTEKNERAHPIMGCYGIGISRLMGVIAETANDERGLVWPESVAPFRFHLIELKPGLGSAIYERLQGEGVGVLYDDRDVSAGEKFADADLMGIPFRLVVSERTGDKIEVKRRGDRETSLISYEDIRALH